MQRIKNFFDTYIWTLDFLSFLITFAVASTAISAAADAKMYYPLWIIPLFVAGQVVAGVSAINKTAGHFYKMVDEMLDDIGFTESVKDKEDVLE